MQKISLTAAVILFCSGFSQSVETIIIDNGWISNPAPYLLDQPDSKYVLQVDVTSESAAFILTTANVTLDLNGHTVTYGQNTAPGVANGGFENGTSPTDIPNWNISGATGARRVAAIRGYWGGWCLQVPVATGDSAVIISDPVAIPKANVDYIAMIQPKLSASGNVKISVVNAVSGAILASGISADPVRGTLALSGAFVPATTLSVKIRFVITNTSGVSITAYLDHADLVRDHVVGVISSPDVSGLPSYLQRPGCVNSSSFRIRNGTITEGAGRSYAGSPVYARSLSGLTLDSVTLYSAGASTSQIEGTHVEGPTVTNCTLTNAMDIIDDPANNYAAMGFGAISGLATFTGNKIRGSQQHGILVTGAPFVSYGTGGYFSNTSKIIEEIITGNDIRTNSCRSGSYGLYLSGAHDFNVADNTIIPVNGSGIFIDGQSGLTASGTVRNNYVEAREKPDIGNSDTAIVATALRIGCGTVRNVTFFGNSFAAYTGPGMAWAAAGARITQLNGWNGSAHCNDKSNDVFTGNTFSAIVTAPDPALNGDALHAGNQAWGLALERVDTGTGIVFSKNLIGSNITPLAFGDNGSYGGSESDAMFISDTISMITGEGAAPNSTGLRTFSSITAGDWQNTVSGIKLIAMHYDNGAKPVVSFLGTKQKDVSTGWLATVQVENGSTPGNGAFVDFKDKNSVLLIKDTADANGMTGEIPVVTEILSEAAGSLIVDTTRLNPLFLHAVWNTSIYNQSVTLGKNKLFVINFGSNQPPLIVGLPAVLTTVTDETTDLNALVGDDGQPAGSTVTIAWSQVSGPAEAVFGSPSAENTTASFPAAGTYIIRITANDSQLESHADITVTVENHLSISDNLTGFGIYPNPASDKINFDISDNMIGSKIEIFDRVGNGVISKMLIEKEQDISGLPNGFYLIRILSDKKIVMGRFIKQ